MRRAQLVLLALLASLASCARSSRPPAAPADGAQGADGAPSADAAARRDLVSRGDALSIVRGRDGVIVVVNRGDAHFTVKLQGKKIDVPEDDAGATFVIDGQTVQLVVLPASRLLPPGKTTPDDEGLLQLHATWETGFLAEQLGVKLEPRLEPRKTAAGAAALRWEVELPVDPAEGDEAMTSNVFLTTVVAGQIVILGSPILKKDDRKAILARLDGILGTLTISKDWLDPQGAVGK